jgi:hypothetical protein
LVIDVKDKDDVDDEHEIELGDDVIGETATGDELVDKKRS